MMLINILLKWHNSFTHVHIYIMKEFVVPRKTIVLHNILKVDFHRQSTALSYQWMPHTLIVEKISNYSSFLNCILYSVDPRCTMRPFTHLENNTIFRSNSNDLSIDLWSALALSRTKSLKSIIDDEMMVLIIKFIIHKFKTTRFSVSMRIS